MVAKNLTSTEVQVAPPPCHLGPEFFFAIGVFIGNRMVQFKDAIPGMTKAYTELRLLVRIERRVERAHVV
jgi:hypothetical protein